MNMIECYLAAMSHQAGVQIRRFEASLPQRSLELTRVSLEFRDERSLAGGYSRFLISFGVRHFTTEELSVNVVVPLFELEEFRTLHDAVNSLVGGVMAGALAELDRKHEARKDSKAELRRQLSDNDCDEGGG